MVSNEEIINETEKMEEKEESRLKNTANALKEPKVIAKIFEIYEETKNFEEVTRQVNKEFGLKASSDSIINCYNKNKKREFIVDPSNTEFFENNFTETKKRWKEAWDMMSWLVKQVRDFQDMLDTQDKNQRVLMAIKSIPQLTTLSKSIIEQLEFLRKETENIKINQKQFIYSPIQLNLEMKKYKNIFVKEELGKIAEEIVYELDNSDELISKEDAKKLVLNKLQEVK